MPIPDKISDTHLDGPIGDKTSACFRRIPASLEESRQFIDGMRGSCSHSECSSSVEQAAELFGDRNDLFDDESYPLGPSDDHECPLDPVDDNAYPLDSRADDTYPLDPRLTPEGSISTSPIEDLPVDVKILLLRQCPDTEALTALSQTSRRFYSAYEFRKRGILLTVLQREMGKRVLSFAVANLQASKLKYSERTQEVKVRRFLNAFRLPEYENTCSSDLRIADLDAIAKFHKTVRFFVNDYRRSTLKTNPATGKVLEHVAPLTDSEWVRIARAFYLFELFSRLFRCPKILNGNHDPEVWEPLVDRKADHFLSLFEAYEVEELACVHDYVIEYLKKVDRHVTEDLSRNPTRWIKKGSHPMRTDYRPRGWRTTFRRHFLRQKLFFISPLWHRDERFDDYRLELLPFHDACLAKGLRYLHRLFDCPDPENLMNIYAEDLENVFDTPFLTDSLKILPHRLLHDSRPCRRYYERYFHRDAEVFKGDDENECNAAWAWANNNVAEYRYAQNSRAVLRAWGYVMWDHPRLDEWGILHTNNFKFRLPPDELDGYEMEAFLDPTLEDLRESHMKICKRTSDHPSCRGDDEVLEDERVEEEEEDVEEDDETLSTTSNNSSSSEDSGTHTNNDGDGDSDGIEELALSEYGSLASDFTESCDHPGCCMKKWWRDLVGAYSPHKQELMQSVSTKIEKVKDWLRKPRDHKKGSENLCEISDAEDDITSTPVPTEPTSDEGTGACNPRFWEERFAVQNPEPAQPTQPRFDLATWLAVTSSPSGPNTPALASQALFDRTDTPSTFGSRSDPSSEFGIVTAVELEDPFLDPPKNGQSLDTDLERTTQDFIANCPQDTVSPEDKAQELSDEFSWGSTSTAVSSSGEKKFALLKLLIKPKGILLRKGKCTTVGAEPATKMSGSRMNKSGGTSSQEISKHINLALEQSKPLPMQHSTTDTGCRDKNLTLREQWTHEVYGGIPQAGAIYEQSHAFHTGLFHNKDKSKLNAKRYKKIQKSEKETLLQMVKLAKERGNRVEVRKDKAAGLSTAWERFEAWTYEQSYLI